MTTPEWHHNTKKDDPAPEVLAAHFTEKAVRGDLSTQRAADMCLELAAEALESAGIERRDAERQVEEMVGQYEELDGQA